MSFQPSLFPAGTADPSGDALDLLIGRIPHTAAGEPCAFVYYAPASIDRAPDHEIACVERLAAHNPYFKSELLRRSGVRALKFARDLAQPVMWHRVNHLPSSVKVLADPSARILSKPGLSEEPHPWMVELRHPSPSGREAVASCRDALYLASSFSLTERPRWPRWRESYRRLRSPSLDPLILALSPARLLHPKSRDPIPPACILASLGCSPRSDQWTVLSDLAMATGQPWAEALALLAHQDPPALDALARLAGSANARARCR